MSGLREALNLGSQALVCLVGAGGKTSLLQRLARECPHESERLLVTTSTKMLKSELESCGPLVLEADDSALFRALAAWDSHVVCAARAVTPDGKAIGLGVSLLDDVYHSNRFPLMLVEADGARGRDLKAPGSGEPIVPSSATTVLAVAGIRALGQPLGEMRVHRPERVAAVARQDVGSLVNRETLVRVMQRYRALSTEMAPRAAFIPVINQADTPQRLEIAVNLAGQLRRSFDLVIITAARLDAYVLQVVR